MELKTTPWSRLAPWLLLLAAAFAAGRWYGLATRTPEVPGAAPEIRPVDHFSRRHEDDLRSLDRVLAAVRSLPRPDARTFAFFEQLGPDEVAAITRQLYEMPSSAERELLLLLALRRWGEVAAPAALEHSNAVENLPLRAEARATVYEVWGRQDAPAAFVTASAESQDTDRARALTALLTGAARTSAGDAVAWWERAPAGFRASPAGELALARIAEVAYNTGQREALQTIVAGLPAGDQRARLTAAVGRYWGRHESEAAVAWLKTITSSGATQDGMIDEVFSALVRKDPVRAAAWAAAHADERRRSNYVAAAVAEWASYDSAGAETWVNEQEEGIYLDGATSAIAAHFIEHRLWPQAFAWTRRILRNEARADLLGNLGRIWNAERPQEFTTFLAQTSLNRAELEMLRGKIVEVASP